MYQVAECSGHWYPISFRYFCTTARVVENCEKFSLGGLNLEKKTANFSPQTDRTKNPRKIHSV
jgi:hypothetical protein